MNTTAPTESCLQRLGQAFKGSLEPIDIAANDLVHGICSLLDHKGRLQSREEMFSFQQKTCHASGQDVQENSHASDLGSLVLANSLYDMQIWY